MVIFHSYVSLPEGTSKAKFCSWAVEKIQKRLWRRLSRSLTRQDDTRPSPMANKASRISSSVASVSTGL